MNLFKFSIGCQYLRQTLPKIAIFLENGGIKKDGDIGKNREIYKMIERRQLQNIFIHGETIILEEIGGCVLISLPNGAWELFSKYRYCYMI